MDIRFVLPSEVEQLARNVVTSFPSKTPAALLQNLSLIHISEPTRPY